MSLSDYQNLSLDDLWKLTFVKSKSSLNILRRIKKYPKMSAKLLQTLRKPLRTGDDVKNRLMVLYPEWYQLRDLKSRKRARINRFIKDSYELDELSLKKSVKKSLKQNMDKLQRNLVQTDYRKSLSNFLDNVDNQQDAKEVLKQVREIGMKSLTNYAKKYSNNRGFKFNMDDLESSEHEGVDVDKIDNIVAATINHEFIRAIIRDRKKVSNGKPTRSSNSPEYTTVAYSKDMLGSETQRWQSSDKTVTLSEDFLGNAHQSWIDKNSITRLSEDFVGNKDQRWKSDNLDVDVHISEDLVGNAQQSWRSSNSRTKLSEDLVGNVDQVWDYGHTYTHLSEDLVGNVDQRWITPDFDIHLSEDLVGNIDQEWKNDYSYIHLTKDLVGNVELVWQVGDTDIHLSQDLNDNIDQKWRFGNVRIYFNIDLVGNIEQKWDFGDTYYFYSKDLNGNLKMYWRNGQADDKNIRKYKEYIDSWCRQNSNYYPAQCVVYDRT